MKPRILQLVPTLERGGAEKQMCLLSVGLLQEKFDVHVCALARGGPLGEELAKAGIPSRVIGKRWRLDPRTLWQLRRHVTQLRPDVIHTWRFEASAYGYATARLCGIRALVIGQACVAPWRSWSELAIGRHIGRQCERSNSSSVVANSPAVRDCYVQQGIPQDNVRVIASGVASHTPSKGTRSRLESEARQDILTEVDLPSNAKLLGLAGRLCSQNRIKDAIWAADLIKVIRDDVHLLVFGVGPQRNRLRRFRDQCAIPDKVHFLGDRGDLARWMPHFDAFWSTGRYEGQANAIMEAMAAGVPVVAANVPETRDLVVPEVTGYAVPMGDRAGFARQTNKLLNDPALAQRMGDAGRQRVEREYPLDTMVERYVALYRELLS